MVRSMHELSKPHKRRLRELSARLYERELKEALASLSLKFDDWKAGKITSLELGDLLHDYDYGESRRLWSKYDTKRHDMIVAEGFVHGWLTEADIGPELLKALDNAIEFYRHEQ
jgi:hypothetical protein